MKVLFVEGKDQATLQVFARNHPHPYRLLYRKEQELFLLELWGHLPELEAEAAKLAGFKSWSFELIEEGLVESK